MPGDFSHLVVVEILHRPKPRDRSILGSLAHLCWVALNHSPSHWRDYPQCSRANAAPAATP